MAAGYDFEEEDTEQKLVSFVHGNPSTRMDFVEKKVFRDMEQANNWFGKRSKKFPIVGDAPKKGRGPKPPVMCGSWKPKQDNMRHELEITRVMLVYFGDVEAVRGPFVGIRRPDAEVKIREHEFDLEMFCGTQTREQVQRRWKKYRDTDRDLRIVVSAKDGKDDVWLQKVKEWSREIYDIAFFTTLKRLIDQGPYEFAWDQFDGKEWIENRIDPPEDELETNGKSIGDSNSAESPQVLVGA